MLLAFLRENDGTCPVCGYNVRALIQPLCPECGIELFLTVGSAPLRIGWLLAAVAPGFFSGIAAIFMLIPVVGMYVNMGRVEPLIAAVDLFGWCSGIFAIFLGIKRTRFIMLPRKRQIALALLIWLIHVAALVTFILFVWSYSW